LEMIYKCRTELMVRFQMAGGLWRGADFTCI
jgi:hypothetical protein